MRKITFFATFILLLTTNLNGQVCYKSRSFKVTGATKSVLYPGVMGSPITTTVSYKMIVKKCMRMELDSFWMDGFSDRVNASFADGSPFHGMALKGDTIQVSLVYFRLTTQAGYPKDDIGIHGSPEVMPPAEHKGGALFRYRSKKKTHYFSIENIKTLESVYAP